MGERSAVIYPHRIVCLSTETTETLYALGAEELIVGISGFTTRPARARREKPKVFAFTTGDIDRVLALEPDLVIGFSDLQLPILEELTRRGVRTHWFDQRSIVGILNMIRDLGRLVGREDAADTLATDLARRVDHVKRESHGLSLRPRVYFEEWDSPLITAIEWVGELIEAAGGINCFADYSRAPLAKDRIIRDANEVIRRAPDVIVGSWCGKKFRPDHVRLRPNWQCIPAVTHNHVYEIKSALILSPGPVALTEGLDACVAIVRRWRCSTA